jgi:hypothetical protein
MENTRAKSIGLFHELFPLVHELSLPLWKTQLTSLLGPLGCSELQLHKTLDGALALVIKAIVRPEQREPVLGAVLIVVPVQGSGEPAKRNADDLRHAAQLLRVGILVRPRPTLDAGQPVGIYISLPGHVSVLQAR